jgi:hypothetical protein
MLEGNITAHNGVRETRKCPSSFGEKAIFTGRLLAISGKDRSQPWAVMRASK